MKELDTIISMTLCFMHQKYLQTELHFNNGAHFLDFCAENYPLIFFYLNPFYCLQTLHFGILNYEIQYKEGICKDSGRSVVL